MLNNITPLEQLKEEAQQIQEFLEIMPSEDGNEAVDRGNELIVHIARTGKMLADAKYHFNQKKSSEVMDTLRKVAKETPHATTKAVNLLVESICREEQFMVDWLERLNRAATHQMEWCRSVVSKAKEEMRLNNVGKEFK
jgi:ElaB/YqjD/DUF883 family membrane-anchored ribosome-binding protein